MIISSDPFPGWAEITRELRARGLQLIAVLVEPASFDPNARSQREVEAQLHIQGIRTYTIRKGDSIPVALAS